MCLFFVLVLGPRQLCGALLAIRTHGKENVAEVHTGSYNSRPEANTIPNLKTGRRERKVCDQH